MFCLKDIVLHYPIAYPLTHNVYIHIKDNIDKYFNSDYKTHNSTSTDSLTEFNLEPIKFQ